MFKRTLIAASMVAAALASAQSMADIHGGGSTLAAPLYNTAGVLTAGFGPFASVGSGNGKSAFLNNNPAPLGLTGVNVGYAGSDSVLTSVSGTGELDVYNAAHNAAGNTAANKWGPLIQIPSAGTSVTVPYKLTLANGAAVADLNLTSAQLCSVFSGAFTTWNQVNAAYPATAIKVFYRSGSSGTSEIFTRHLNTVCPTQIGVSSTFTAAQVGGVVPASFTAVANGAAMASSANATEGGIGYVGPEELDATNNAKVAKVNGILPTVGNVTTALSTIAPPTGTAINNPANWVPLMPSPTSGYPIVAYTNLILGQCYVDSTEGGQVRALLARHYGASVNNDSAIIAQKLIPLSAQWKLAIRNNFASQTAALGVNNTSVCNAQGRPL